MKLAAVVIAGVVFVALTPGSCSEESDSATTELREFMPVDPSYRTNVNPPSGGAVIEAGVDETTAKVHLGWKLGDKQAVSLEFTAPVNDAGEATFVNFDGPTASLGAELGWSMVVGEVTPANHAQRNATSYPRGSSGWRKDARADYSTSPVLVYPTVVVGVGRTEFGFLDPTTLADSSETKFDYSASAGLGLLSKDNHFFSLSYKYRRSFQAQDEVDICNPIPGSTALQCDSARLGGPATVKTSVAAIEYRKMWKHYAIAPRLAREFEADVTGFDLPFYVLKNADNGFTGGVRVGWRSDDHDFSGSVFVGKQFTLLNR